MEDGMYGPGMGSPEMDMDGPDTQGPDMGSPETPILKAINGDLFDTPYAGELTYYGGAGDQGMCTQSWVPPGLTTVALNAPQFGNGEMCGTCINACFNDLGLGQGERCFDAIIDNMCPECALGDIDLGEDGDGRWPVEWSRIVCPTGTPIVSTQGSNKYFGKVKVEGGPSSVTGMFCTDEEGNEFEGEQTSDAFWEFDSGSGAFECGLQCQVFYSCCYSIGSAIAAPELFGGDGSDCMGFIDQDPVVDPDPYDPSELVTSYYFEGCCSDDYCSDFYDCCT